MWALPVSTFGFDRLLRNRRGNVAMMYALVAPILVFSGGAAVDYGRAAQIHTKLNAAADAAALAALTPAMLQQSSDVAQTAATNMFHGLADGLPGLTAAPQVSVTVTTDPISLKRNVSLTYSSSVNTIFAQVLGKSTLPIGGMSQASAQAPPNIDFYVLLDNSPSMALPATAAGITQMQNLTSKETLMTDAGSGGCAFACHQASTNNSDSAGNPCADGTTPTQSGTSPAKKTVTNAYCTSKQGAQIDNYALARKNNITLRLDELNSGISTLLQTASATANSTVFATPPKYRFSIYSMDSLWQIGLSPLMSLTANYTSGWTSASANFGVMEMYSNNNDCANAACSSSTSTPGGDVATNYDNALGDLSQASYIPNPGNGTNQNGDTPQEVLFIVTDGVEDEQSGSRLQQAINDLGSAPGGNSSSKNWCTTIKNRGVKIAVLYTDYLAVPANAWYEQYIAPIQSDIGPALQACASPGLFYDAAIGSDLGAALSALFAAVTQSGHLTQ
jgi:Flp pilus assembly protein TadG